MAPRRKSVHLKIQTGQNLSCVPKVAVALQPSNTLVVIHSATWSWTGAMTLWPLFYVVLHIYILLNQTTE